MVLLETELWPGLLYMLKKHKIKTIIINGRLSSKTYLRYLKTKFLWENISPEIILATSEKDKQRFKNIFGKKAQIGIMPNIKFDAIPSTTETKSSIMVQLAEILPSDIPLSILASIRKEEENHLEKIIQYLIQKFPDQIIAIFPKHMQRINPLSKMLARLANKTGIKWQLKSMINNKLDKKTIILWDTFGELKHAYAFATTAFVGGSLEPLGGQNFLEPVISGAATITGPFLNSFKWINKEIFNSNIVFKAQNAHEVGKFMVQQLTNPPDKEKIKQKSLEYIRKNQGGTALAIKIINKNLKN
jgi:3-deoxy-D-manno-octulosonic-acid transferase